MNKWDGGAGVGRHFRDIDAVGLDVTPVNLFLAIACHGFYLVHAILGIRSPAKTERRGSDSQDRMDQRGKLLIARSD